MKKSFYLFEYLCEMNLYRWFDKTKRKEILFKKLVNNVLLVDVMEEWCDAYTKKNGFKLISELSFYKFCLICDFK